MDVGVLAPVALQKIHGLVVGDAKEPRPQRGHLGLQAERIERLRQRLLHDVLALDHRAREARAVAVQLRPDGIDEPEELLAGLRERREGVRPGHGGYFCAHPVVLRVAAPLPGARPKHLEHRRHVHPEAPTHSPFFSPYQPFTRIARTRGPRPRRSLRRGLLLVRAPERHPVPVALQHGVEVLDAPQVIAKLAVSCRPARRAPAGPPRRVPWYAS